MKFGTVAFMLSFVVASIAAAEVPALGSSASDAFTLTPRLLDETPATHTASPAHESESWHFSLGIPVWLAGVKGDINIRGTELSPDQDTGDSLDLITSHLNMAAALHFEANNSRFGFFADAIYVDFRADSNLSGSGDAEGFLKGAIGEFAGFYSIISPEKHARGAFRLDAFGGVRVTSLTVGIDDDSFNGSFNVTLFDPMVGARLQYSITDRLDFRLRGDVGGFGIDAWNTSNMTYNADAALVYSLCDSFRLGLGYRWLKYDFESDSGRSTFDASLSGPYVLLEYAF
jgi:hypothetical protein